MAQVSADAETRETGTGIEGELDKKRNREEEGQEPRESGESPGNERERASEKEQEQNGDSKRQKHVGVTK